MSTLPGSPSPADTGEVAGSIPKCSEQPPAQPPLKNKDWRIGNDGVVGAIYNGTRSNIFVGFPSQGRCYIEAGRSAAYSVVEQLSMDVGYLPTLAVSPTASGSGPICVATLDPYSGDPGVLIDGIRLCGSSLSFNRIGRQDISTKMTTLDEGDQVELTRDGAVVAFTRLEDDGDIAKQWTGTDSWSVTDWARIDITVKSL